MEKFVDWLYAPPHVALGERYESPEVAEQEMALFEQATKKLK